MEEIWRTSEVAARIVARIADELTVRAAQVAATVALLDEGATVPFIARYRKEATGGLDDTQLRLLDERLSYLRDLEARRATVRETIAGQGKLTDELAAQIDAADTKAALDGARDILEKRKRGLAPFPSSSVRQQPGLLAQCAAAQRSLGGDEHAQGA